MPDKKLTPEEIKRQLEVLVRVGTITSEEADRRYQLFLRKYQEEQRKKRAEDGKRDQRRSQHSRRSRGKASGRGGRPARRRKRPKYDGKLRAPYRFVEIPDEVVPPPTETAPALNKPLENGYETEIAVTWTVETPFLIGELRSEQTRARPQCVGPIKRDGRYVVPASSLRGMIRSVVEIITFSRLSQFNDYTYPLRDFEHPAYGEGEYPVGDVTQVRAGWLRYVNGKWILSPCDWYLIEIVDLLQAKWLQSEGMSREDWIQKGLKKKYELAGLWPYRKPFDTSRRYSFKQEEDSINDESKDKGKDKEKDKEKGKDKVKSAAGGKLAGFPVFADRVPSANANKKREYVFVDRENAPQWELTAAEVEQFERFHSRPGTKSNKFDPDGSWKLLHKPFKAGTPIPVFFIGNPDGEVAAGGISARKPFAMGLTRLFKVPHRYSVGEVLARHGRQREKTAVELPSGGNARIHCDFAAALFGFVHENDAFTVRGMDEDDPRRPSALALKGRVRFSFGYIPENEAQESEKVRTILMGPRASFSSFYLRGEYKDYSADGARLSGRKRYVPRYPGGNAAAADMRGQMEGHIPQALRNNLNIQTELIFLLPREGARAITFTSRIRMHNVAKEEIGAILWALTFGGCAQARHMLGHARPFGAGQVKAEATFHRISANNGGETPSEEECLRAFEDYMERKRQGWRNSAPIRELLALADPATGARLAREGELEYIRDVKDFAKIRKMTKPLRRNKAEIENNWTPPSPLPPKDRYLKTPKESTCDKET